MGVETIRVFVLAIKLDDYKELLIYIELIEYVNNAFEVYWRDNKNNNGTPCLPNQKHS